MTAWILILVIADGSSVVRVDGYKTEQSCQDAGKRFVDKIGFVSYGIKFACMPVEQ